MWLLVQPQQRWQSSRLDPLSACQGSPFSWAKLQSPQGPWVLWSNMGAYIWANLSNWRIFCFFRSILEVLGVRQCSKNAPGTHAIIFLVLFPRIVHSRPISTQLWFQIASPILCISARQRLCISGRQTFSMSGRQRLLLSSTRKISVCLEDRDCCYSPQR